MLRERGTEAGNIARRGATVEHDRQKRGLIKRDMKTVLATGHNKTDNGYTQDTPSPILFSDYNSHILSPNVPVGPYYVGGEYIRKNVVETREGIPLTLDFQVIDVDKCEPVSGVYLDIWHANSTGVYGGIVVQGNGNANDTSNFDKNFLRGIQKTDHEGVAQFETLFPGHYDGRPTHIHIMVDTNTTVLPNNTLGFDTFASSIGQVIFDQDLIFAADEIPPYNTNQQLITLNADDAIILPVATQIDGLDPIVEYTMLGDKLEDGLFGWLALGVNMTWTWEATPASWLTEHDAIATSGGDGIGAPPGFSIIPPTSAATTSITATKR